MDLIVANDSTPNYLYINKGDGTFQDASYFSGFALNQEARETASMGLAVGDYLNNGRVDLYTTTFSDDYKTLFRNEGGGNFSEIHRNGDRRDYLSLPELGYRVHRLRQRWMERHHVGQRPCLPAGRQHHDWGMTFAERPLLFHNLNTARNLTWFRRSKAPGWPMSSQAEGLRSEICSTTARSTWS